jgi:hypothetical protein
MVDQPRPTIGFLTSGIGPGVGLAIWSGVVDAALRHGANLFTLERYRACGSPARRETRRAARGAESAGSGSVAGREPKEKPGFLIAAYQESLRSLRALR